MIRSFKDRDAAALFSGGHPKRFQAFERSAVRKLQQLNQAKDLVRDIGKIPGNRLKQLGGDRTGQWSMRINDQWRLCFAWQDGDAFDVDIVDYH